MAQPRRLLLIAKSKKPPNPMHQMLFHCALATFFTHELDAMQQQEWRLLYGLRTLTDPAAAFLFVALHPPLFAAVTYVAFHTNAAIQLWSRRLLCVFFLLHALLHWRLMGAPLAPFNSALSLTLIHACALFGGLYLVLDGCQATLSKRRLR
jgi:O-antigen/teichoic acid export membrane protein